GEALAQQARVVVVREQGAHLADRLVDGAVQVLGRARLGRRDRLQGRVARLLLERGRLRGGRGGELCTGRPTLTPEEVVDAGAQRGLRGDEVRLLQPFAPRRLDRIPEVRGPGGEQVPIALHHRSRDLGVERSQLAV